MLAAERHGGTGDAHAEGAVRASASLRKQGARPDGDRRWISFCNGKRPHWASKMMTPDAAYAAALTQWPEHKTVGNCKSAMAAREF
ncbi:hypothetical protein [Stenotrophomonas sp. TWI809]|uniref:hypothetical protein n=1 Tax=Stenotrophomonas sp. TWI809 TaxID=3136796 RepID=UPI00320AA99C